MLIKCFRVSVLLLLLIISTCVMGSCSDSYYDDSYYYLHNCEIDDLLDEVSDRGYVAFYQDDYEELLSKINIYKLLPLIEEYDLMEEMTSRGIPDMVLMLDECRENEEATKLLFMFAEAIDYEPSYIFGDYIVDIQSCVIHNTDSSCVERIPFSSRVSMLAFSDKWIEDNCSFCPVCSKKD